MDPVFLVRDDFWPEGLDPEHLVGLGPLVYVFVVFFLMAFRRTCDASHKTRSDERKIATTA